MSLKEHTIADMNTERDVPLDVDPTGPEMFGHPKGLFYLFFAELWERFSFYGMRALLVLYMVNDLLFSDSVAFGIYAAYGALVYATPVIGGMLADRLLGYRKSIMLGAVLMSIGHFALAVEEPIFFYGALALLIVGNGFFKPNISTLVGTLYKQGDARRDAGFTIFYMGINIGAMLAPLVCGYLGAEYGWHYGFGAAGVGMLLGLLMFWNGTRTGVFGENGYPPNPVRLREKVAGISRGAWVVVCSVLSLPVFGILLYHGILEVPGIGDTELDGHLIDYAMYYVLLPAIAIVLFINLVKESKVERQRLIVVILLTFFITVFWSFFEQAGSSLTLFAERNVDLDLNLGLFVWEMNAAQTNAINPFFIVLFALPFSALWLSLSKMHMNPFTPVKFALGIAQLGLGFLIFSWSANFADANGQVSVWFLIAGYMFITTGELFISPVGLSKVTELSPAKIVSFIMGIWFLSSSFAHHIAGIIAKFTSVSGSGDQEVSGAESLLVYTTVFEQIAYVAFGFAVLALILTPLMRKWMHGIH
ncbi:POT family proton-dependent oligopeptide transporter [Pontibacter ummariensis]|uniref:Proton-dependent oligopeptide transporter, POT family n=1 Tax=Pontibacter ummariensis TaxID=1610492 RepID=A0A239BMF0_9BACT|nr:peptide MFS transporter [Pontibacter ummariensis]PRY15727.1 POT family proton-dependent oligopeptide transporter [Pontibacter ummariensis]SNS09325.1 proton-dependent oligopeptide transporter, POT family [Pontibacter ummariensis]